MSHLCKRQVVRCGWSIWMTEFQTVLLGALGISFTGLGTPGGWAYWCWVGSRPPLPTPVLTSVAPLKLGFAEDFVWRKCSVPRRFCKALLWAVVEPCVFRGQGGERELGHNMKQLGKEAVALGLDRKMGVVSVSKGWGLSILSLIRRKLRSLEKKRYIYIYMIRFIQVPGWKPFERKTNT